MPRVVLKWDAQSDGDPNHKPTSSATVYRPADPEHELFYRQKLGQQLMTESGRAEKGNIYVLDRLPQGYVLWEKPRPSGPKHIDRYLYGHPTHAWFDSPNAFFPHLKWLSDGQEGSCQCIRCGQQVRPPSRLLNTQPMSSGKPLKTRGRPKSLLSRTIVDEEGVPHTIPLFLSVLQKEGKVEGPTEESLSMDWCVESTVSKETRERLSSQPSFVPRVGEIVLWYWNIDGELKKEPATGQLKVWDGASRAFKGHPTWLGGVVTQIPIISQPVQVGEITHKTKKRYNVNQSGFRIECYPDPDEDDKAFSKQYTYVHMNHIRPMALFLDVMNGISDTKWHPTIFNALKAMTCVSCIDRYKLKGKWPDFQTYYRGMFFGAECHWINEPIRLVPRKENEMQITEVIIPKKVVVRTYGIRPETNGTVTGTNADSIELLLQGQIYTTNPRNLRGQPAKIPESSSILHPYGPWFHLEGADDHHEIQYQHTAGRLFEYEAMKHWWPGIKPAAALDAGLKSINFARNYAIQSRIQKRVSESGFVWGEHRAEALDLATFNGIDVGNHDLDRDPQRWRQILALLDAKRNINIPEGLAANAPKVVIPVARPGNSAPSSAIQPLGHTKEREVIEILSDSDSETGSDADVNETIEGLIRGVGLGGEDEMMVDGDGERSSKRARVQ